MVREAVEIGQGKRVQGHLARRGDRLALGPADDGAGEMKVGAALAAARKDEASERLEMLVHLVYLALEPVDLRLDDPEHRLARAEILAGRREVGAEIEQFILDRDQHGPVRRVADPG